MFRDELAAFCELHFCVLDLSHQRLNLLKISLLLKCILLQFLSQILSRIGLSVGSTTRVKFLRIQILRAINETILLALYHNALTHRYIVLGRLHDGVWVGQHRHIVELYP